MKKNVRKRQCNYGMLLCYYIRNIIKGELKFKTETINSTFQ